MIHCCQFNQDFKRNFIIYFAIPFLICIFLRIKIIFRQGIFYFFKVIFKFLRAIKVKFLIISCTLNVSFQPLMIKVNEQVVICFYFYFPTSFFHLITPQICLSRFFYRYITSRHYQQFYNKIF